jgi:hypothetical protein
MNTRQAMSLPMKISISMIILIFIAFFILLLLKNSFGPNYFSLKAFQTIAKGDTKQTLLHTLGEPDRTVFYDAKKTGGVSLVWEYYRNDPNPNLDDVVTLIVDFNAKEQIIAKRVVKAVDYYK